MPLAVGEEEAPTSRETVPNIYDLLGHWNLLEVFNEQAHRCHWQRSQREGKHFLRSSKQLQLLWTNAPSLEV